MMVRCSTRRRSCGLTVVVMMMLMCVFLSTDEVGLGVEECERPVLFFVSAVDNDGVDDVIHHLEKRAPQGDW